MCSAFPNNQRIIVLTDLVRSEMMMSLKSSPLARLPPGADVSMLAGPSGKGSGARGGRNSNKDEAETGRGLQFANAPGENHERLQRVGTGFGVDPKHTQR